MATAPDRLVRTTKAVLIGLLLALAVAVALAVPAGASSRVVTSPKVLRVLASRRSVPDTGGVVHFTVVLRGANECRVGIAGRSTVVLAFPRAWARCTNGTFLHAIRFGANSGSTALDVSFRLYLRRGPDIHWYPLGNVRIDGAPLAPTTTTAPAPSFTQTPNWSGYVVQPALPFQQSANWSGYVVPSSSALITNVSGEWTVPTLNCIDTPNPGVSTWVGTGGAGDSSGDLLQTGVREYCSLGFQQDYGWWEEAPGSPNSEVPFVLSVWPGDSIEASVYQDTTGQWVTRLDNLTTGLSGWMITSEAYGVGTDGSGTFTDQGSTTDLTYSGGYTAEWIVEDYELIGSYVSFANYGTVSFSDLQLSGLSPWYLTAGEGCEIVQNGVVLSTPSSPLPSTDSFSVSYTGP